MGRFSYPFELLGCAEVRRAGECRCRAVHVAPLGDPNGGAQLFELFLVAFRRGLGDRRAAAAAAAMGLHGRAVFGAPADAVLDLDLHVVADADPSLQHGKTADICGVLQIDCVAAKRRPEEASQLLRADHQVGEAFGKAVAPIAVEENIDALISEKTALAKDLLEDGAETLFTEMDNEALLKLVSLDIDKAQV